MFNSDRRFYEKLQDTGTYLDSVAENETPAEIYTVKGLLNDTENAELLKALLSVDKLTLQISVLKINGYSTNEIAVLVPLSTDAIYNRIAVLKKKTAYFISFTDGQGEFYDLIVNHNQSGTPLSGPEKR